MKYLPLTNPAKVVDWARTLVSQLTQRDAEVDRDLSAVPTILVFQEVAAASVATPGSGSQALFIDSADHKLKRKDSSGTVTVLG